MKEFSNVIVRAVVIVIVFSSIGVMVNAVAQKRLSWIYVPPTEIVVAGVKVPLIDEREGRRYLNVAEIVFVDTREEKDYCKDHVKGSVFLSPDNVEERFLSVQYLLPDEGQLILYCYRPGCHMAEEVAEFLAQRGYQHMMIMSAGFDAWAKAGYPVERSGGQSDPCANRTQGQGKTETGKD